MNFTNGKWIGMYSSAADFDSWEGDSAILFKLDVELAEDDFTGLIL